MSSKANGMSTLEIDVGDIRPVSVGSPLMNWW
jgi:hypothetical protein